MTKKDFLDFICYMYFHRNYDDTVALVRLILLNMQTIFYWCFGNTFSYYLDYFKYNLLGLKKTNFDELDEAMILKMKIDAMSNKIIVMKREFDEMSAPEIDLTKTVLAADLEAFNKQLADAEALEQTKLNLLRFAHMERKQIIENETDEELNASFNTILDPTLFARKGRYPLRTEAQFREQFREDMQRLWDELFLKIRTYFFGPKKIYYVEDVEEQMRIDACSYDMQLAMEMLYREITEMRNQKPKYNYPHLNEFDQLSPLEEWFEDWFEANYDGMVKCIFTFFDYYIWILFPIVFVMGIIIFLHCCLGLYSVYVDYYYKNPLNIFDRYAMYPAVFVSQYLWFILLSLSIFFFSVPYIYIIWIIFL